jgi:hypothetical protein
VDIVSSERMEKGVNPSWAKNLKRVVGFLGFSYFPQLLFPTTLKIIKEKP